MNEKKLVRFTDTDPGISDFPLTIGKIYEVASESQRSGGPCYFLVEDDLGQKNHGPFYQRRFEVVEEDDFLDDKELEEKQLKEFLKDL